MNLELLNHKGEVKRTVFGHITHVYWGAEPIFLDDGRALRSVDVKLDEGSHQQITTFVDEAAIPEKMKASERSRARALDEE